MATDKGKAAFAFVKSYLERRPGTPFSEIREAGAAKGHKIWPIVYGRAQLLLGQAGDAKPKSATRRKGKAAAKKSASAPRPLGRRGPGRPRKVAAGGSSMAVEALVTHIRELEEERDELREKLEQVRELVGAS